MAKRIRSFYLPGEVISQLELRARRENRSTNNFLATLLQSQFTKNKEKVEEKKGKIIVEEEQKLQK